jgi:hypothetical protein
MSETLSIVLRIAGAGLMLLAASHVAIGRHLRWQEEIPRLSLANASIFRVHTFFICLLLVLMGLPCVLEPSIFLEHSRAGAWLAWSFSIFWTIRLFLQWFGFPCALWRGKRLETLMHGLFTVLWVTLALLFAACGLEQLHQGQLAAPDTVSASAQGTPNTKHQTPNQTKKAQV